ncbi:hypothetical protein [Dysgonomonas gadei]|uniref:hypothetical protein n=1 Tax=Dysgonomonas gadei TaxID=156974 RepID=UPI003AF177C6
MALPKTNQKASAPVESPTLLDFQFLGDLSTVCRLKVTNGLSPSLFLRRLHRTGARLRL